MTRPELASPEALLAWLGSSKDADEVADKLRELGVKGCVTDGGDCPVYNALKLAGGVQHVTAWWVRLRSNERVDLPPAVQDFIAAFDREGAYPDLIAESSHA